MCQYDAFPAYKWFSSSDDSGLFPGLVCFKVENPPPGDSWRTWASWWKIASKITEFPW